MYEYRIDDEIKRQKTWNNLCVYSFRECVHDVSEREREMFSTFHI